MIDLVVERLAENGWCALPGFLPDELVARLAKEAESLRQAGQMTAAATGQGRQREIRASLRDDAIAWMDERPASEAQREYLTVSARAAKWIPSFCMGSI